MLTGYKILIQQLLSYSYKVKLFEGSKAVLNYMRRASMQVFMRTVKEPRVGTGVKNGYTRSSYFAASYIGSSYRLPWNCLICWPS